MNDHASGKRALAAGALGLGLAGSAVAAGSRVRQQQPSQVLVFAYDYQPGTAFQVVTQFQQSVVDAVLGGTDQQESVVSDPADYNSYLVVYQAGENTRGEYTLVFVRNAVLQSDQQYRFSGDVSFYNTQANLLQATITAGAATDAEAEETTETTTTENEGGG